MLKKIQSPIVLQGIIVPGAMVVVVVALAAFDSSTAARMRIPERMATNHQLMVARTVIVLDVGHCWRVSWLSEKEWPKGRAKKSRRRKAKEKNRCGDKKCGWRWERVAQKKKESEREEKDVLHLLLQQQTMSPNEWQLIMIYPLVRWSEEVRQRSQEETGEVDTII